MKIIKDLRILKHFENAYNIKFDKKLKYLIDDSKSNVKYFDFKMCCYGVKYKNNNYFIEYFDGCFYPYLVIDNNRKIIKFKGDKWNY